MVRRRANRLASPGKPLKDVKVEKAEAMIRGIGTGGGAAPAVADAGGSEN